MFYVEKVILMPNQANSGNQDKGRTISTRSPILDCKYLFKQLQHRGEVARELLVLRSLRNWESNQQVMHKSSGGTSCLQIETQESNPFKYQRISVIMVGLAKVLQTDQPSKADENYPWTHPTFLCRTGDKTFGDWPNPRFRVGRLGLIRTGPFRVVRR